MSPTDFAQTPHAINNRQTKANNLAVRAADFGFMPFDLGVDELTVADQARRDKVRRALKLRSQPSPQTWALALTVLEVGARGRTGVTPCAACSWPVLIVRAASGAGIALDPFAHPRGTVWVDATTAPPTAHVVAGHQTPPDGVALFRQHATTCPKTKVAADRRHLEAPRCTVCGHPLDGVLAQRDPAYTTHPNCQEGRRTP